MFLISLHLVQQHCPPASYCCVCSALTQKGECHLLSHRCPPSSWVSLEFFNACVETRINPSCFVNEPNARPKQGHVASTTLPCPKRPLQPEPSFSHHPVTFSLMDLFCLTWATCINLGSVEYVAAQKFTEGCDLLSLFHFSASSAPDVLFDTLVMFFLHAFITLRCHTNVMGTTAGLQTRQQCWG